MATKMQANYLNHACISVRSLESLTRIAGFKVQSANHYTMGPCL